MIRSLRLALLVGFVCASGQASADDGLQFGFGKKDITPEVPLRLSGYSSRSEPSEGVDEPLFVRAMAMRAGDEGPLNVLVSVDTIGFAGTLTKSIFERVAEQHSLTRERFVICCTHSHTAPEVGALSDMFEVAFTEEQKQDTAAYTKRVADQVVAAVDVAIEDLRPGRLFAGEGEATFAVNRRIITDGAWSGFGINSEGAVDHRLPFLKITDADGTTIRGIVFNYACHCTTFGGEYNRVNGDWAGYAAKYLEEAHEGATALCTIGTGADANPQRDREQAFELAQAQGREIADEITGLIDGDLTEVTARPTASFGYAGLPIDRPTKEQLEENLKNSRRPVRLHAENMLATWERMGRLPETYPMPIQVWRFGDEFAMVFLGGEVCVDYGLRIKRELGPEGGTASAGESQSDDPTSPAGRSSGTDNSPPSTLNSQLTPWVVAYANDVFGYVASERMRPEGGYEVDFSMIYYMLPGRWSSGTEEVIMRRVHEMYESTGKVGPLSPEDARGTFTLPKGYRLDLVAAEPLVRDPINMALDEGGRLWVVEMGDYPRGKCGPGDEFRPGDHPWEGPPGGAIKRLTDTDGDGRYDEAVAFLDGLSFPTGVHPWQDGVIVSAAPDIFFARDTDGDGKADEREVLYTGFEEANPQHRINGFVEGHDGWLYLASGTNNGTITSTKTGETLDMSGRDLRIRPETGELETLSGRSQFGRTCDAYGNWFGNDNSNPLWHYVIEDRYLRRNPFVAAPSPKVSLTDVQQPKTVYPTSRTLDRFNDLFALNRYTSACGPHIWRAMSHDEQLTALVCEPVHNLVSRIMLEPEGVTFRGRRHEDEQTSEFFSSTDNWFRPVKIIEDPQGNLLICDMYRMVIEHPQWIPEAWQAQLDLYAGKDMGRIWRLTPPDDLNGPIAVRNAQFEKVIREKGLGIGFVPGAAELLEDKINEGPGVLAVVLSMANVDDIRVRFRVALALGEVKDNPAIGNVLLGIAKRDPDDPWIRAAVLSSSMPHALSMLRLLLQAEDAVAANARLLEGLIATALGEEAQKTAPLVARMIAGGNRSEDVQPWQPPAMASLLDVLQRRGSSWDEVLSANEQERDLLAAAVEPIFAFSRLTAHNDGAEDAERAAALSLLGYERSLREEDVEFLESLLSPRVSPTLQAAAIDVLAQRLNERLPTVLLADWKQHAPSLRSTVISTLLTRDRWTEALVAALESGDVPPGDLDAASRQRLMTGKRPLRDAVARIYGNGSPSDRADVVAAYSQGESQSGDVERGAAVFKRVCAACHKLDGIGNDLAPPLTQVTNKSTDALLTAILDPNRAVEQKYQGYVVVTNDGRALSGLIKSETGSSLTLAEPNGKEHVLLRIDIDQMQSTGKSFMPEGLEKDLSPQDVADVIEFVRAAK